MLPKLAMLPTLHMLKMLRGLLLLSTPLARSPAPTGGRTGPLRPALITFDLLLRPPGL
jgi:hypothetical protein